jgi:hypothetical protein
MTGSHEVRGSIPLGSTSICNDLASTSHCPNVLVIMSDTDIWFAKAIASPAFADEYGFYGKTLWDRNSNLRALRESESAVRRRCGTDPQKNFEYRRSVTAMVPIEKNSFHQ